MANARVRPYGPPFRDGARPQRARNSIERKGRHPMKSHNRYWDARVSGAIAFMVGVVLSSATVQAVLPPGNSVQQWNKIAEDTVVASGAFQNEGLIYMAYVS